MPRKKTAPSDNIVLRMPHQMQQDIIDLLGTKKTEYKDFSDFIMGATRNEIRRQHDKIDMSGNDYSVSVRKGS